MSDLPAPLAPLLAWPQWALWRSEADPDTGKARKRLFQTSGYPGASTKPQHWTTYALARGALDAAPPGTYGGLAFVFTDADPFWFLDVDNCREGDGWSAAALDIISRFPGCAVEVSQSGSGLHVFGSSPPGVPSGPGRKFGGLEFYTRERFVALTGNCSDQGSAAAVIDWRPFVDARFPASAVTRQSEWTTEPCEGWRGPEDDDELIRRMLASKSVSGAFTDRPTIHDYWHADAAKLGKAWPHAHDPWDQSSADSAFATMVAWWTGRDCERTERIMRRSALVRDKWDRDTYLAPTILNASAVVTGCYCEPEKPAPLPGSGYVPPPLDPDSATEGPQRGVDQVCHDWLFPKHFDGCVYVVEQNRVFHPRHGRMLDKSRMDAVLGGFTFFRSAMGKDPTRSAWEAFLNSSHYVPPIAVATTFDPRKGYGEVLTGDDGMQSVNVHNPYTPPMCEGDPAPFLDFIGRCFPDERDQRILLTWMAALVQHPGVKFRWWPVIQGVKGSGKTLLTEIIKPMFRSDYWHVIGYNETSGDSPHNAWLENKLFLIVEEIDQSNKRSFLEKMKELVTNNHADINPKGQDQRRINNHANGILLTNHMDGVPIDEDERRYCVFYQHQQSALDLLRDGLTESYFIAFDHWLRRESGMEIVAKFLSTYQMAEEFNPAGRALRAPRTSSFMQAVNNSIGVVEQEIQEAINEARPGFRGGWVSGHFLALLLTEKRLNLAPRKRREAMRRLGYDWHPSMLSGSPSNPVMPDNKRPTLYVRRDHPIVAQESSGEAARHYVAMQNIEGGVKSEAELAFLPAR